MYLIIQDPSQSLVSRLHSVPVGYVRVWRVYLHCKPSIDKWITSHLDACRVSQDLEDKAADRTAHE
jgi:hypothetical protein